MNRAYDQVITFHTACGIEMPSKPTLLSGAGEANNKYWAVDIEGASRLMKSFPEIGGEVKKRGSFMLEELAEFFNAETIEDQADALTDLIYFAIGTFTLMGLKPEKIFDIVAQANLGKISPDGTVLRDEQGKIKKPDGWQENFAPESKIKEEIQHQTDKGVLCFYCKNKLQTKHEKEISICLDCTSNF